ncbi:helix-turn-helix domain-containing protein [Roseovarius aestuarii]|uniref:Bifunctional transcriptional activator/DNA repair enzyme AdaA n=1 Tax=Roseovarius aestuarii TaxID=475083 RepID=A0A1X7BPZ2_9RHOB|nr:helix-turn-helix domain-containing protein [Roseovarius aestuarii]SMC11604.1 Bifunctional transcriptional activator/DNA repair enzyme AdaA [Roseovarius aestuarii]
MSHPIRILTLAQWADGSNWRWELQHSLETHALIWITRGQGLCTIEGRRRGVGVHNAFAIPAKALFSFDLGKQIFGLITLIPARSPILMPDEPQHLRIRDAQAQAELTSILDALQREQINARTFSDEAMTAHAHLLTIWLRRAMIAQGAQEDKTSAAENLLKAFTALIERDFRTNKPMADYARTLGVTPTHLTRCCRQCCGLTAAAMLTERTVHAARDLLEESNIPIQNIASRLGFNSAAYFSRFILQNTGQTPSALRKRKSRKTLTAL